MVMPGSVSLFPPQPRYVNNCSFGVCQTTIRLTTTRAHTFTHQDVFEGVTLKDVRAIFQKQPRNFALLLHKLVLVLEDAVNFPESSKYPVALTCVRL